MRSIFAGVLLSVALVAPALADSYNVTVTMANPGGNTAQCKLYVGSTAAAGGNKACGQAVSYPGLFPTEGSYPLSYAGVAPKGTEGDKSPVLTVVVAKEDKPPTPTNPPNAVVRCLNGTVEVTCPSNIAISTSP